MWKVRLDSFEGPLDLLLHLVEKAEVDIYEISLAEIADQYVDYIRQAREEQLEILSEYLVMAATLLAMKSRMLLPRTEIENEDADSFDEEELDLRQALIERLVEYKKYKQVAQVLQQEEAKRSLIYTRPMTDLTQFDQAEPQQPAVDVTLYELVGAFFNVLVNQSGPPINTVERDDISLEERMREIRKMLVIKGEVTFNQLFASARQRTYIIVTFLALLELVRKKEVYCRQEQLFSEIKIGLTEEVPYGS